MPSPRGEKTSIDRRDGRTGLEVSIEHGFARQRCRHTAGLGQDQLTRSVVPQPLASMHIDMISIRCQPAPIECDRAKAALRGVWGIGGKIASQRRLETLEIDHRQRMGQRQIGRDASERSAVQPCTATPHRGEAFVPTGVVNQTELDLATPQQGKRYRIERKSGGEVTGTIQGIQTPQTSGIVGKHSLLFVYPHLLTEKPAGRADSRQTVPDPLLNREVGDRNDAAIVLSGPLHLRETSLQFEVRCLLYQVADFIDLSNRHLRRGVDQNGTTCRS